MLKIRFFWWKTNCNLDAIFQTWRITISNEITWYSAIEKWLLLLTYIHGSQMSWTSGDICVTWVESMVWDEVATLGIGVSRNKS